MENKFNIIIDDKGKIKLVNNLNFLINSAEEDETVYFFLSSKLKQQTIKENLLFYNIQCENIKILKISEYAEDFLELNINFTPVLIYINKINKTNLILPVFYTFKGIKI